tara:strand:+ start:28259 stop:29419 length:1161 start_codon:yes stop_codon:yes gene_type:complete
MRNQPNIPFSKVFIGENERKYLKDVLDSGWLTTGNKTLEFEKKFAKFVGVKYACAVSSCTAALHLAVEALGVKEYDKVLIPSMTFASTAEIVRYVQADIIPVDVEYGTNLITPSILKEVLKKHNNIKLLIVVHFAGQAAQMNEIINICNHNGIKVIEDAAHAFPSKYENKYIGNFSDITCFSFYANKTITTGEGGMLVTNNKDLYKRVKTMRLHGINRDVWDRFNSKVPSWEYDVIDAGYKYNMPDLASAIGLGQLENAHVLRNKRQKAVEFYYKHLSGLSMIDLPICHTEFENHAWHLFSIVINKTSKISRNQFIEKMFENRIGCSVHYKPIHQLTYYKERYKLVAKDYPNTQKTWEGNVSLPLYPSMSLDDLEYVVSIIKKILV